MTRTEKMREDFRRQLADQHELEVEVGFWEGIIIAAMIFGGIAGIGFLCYLYERW